MRKVLTLPEWIHVANTWRSGHVHKQRVGKESNTSPGFQIIRYIDCRFFNCQQSMEPRDLQISFLHIESFRGGTQEKWKAQSFMTRRSSYRAYIVQKVVAFTKYKHLPARSKLLLAEEEKEGLALGRWQQIIDGPLHPLKFSRRWRVDHE
jgi:hypothetical protein